jgi:uncharacterized protein (DUF2336 family)
MQHEETDSSASAATEVSPQSVQPDAGTLPQSLIDELEEAITRKDLRHRAAVMRRVTDLFILNGADFTEEHIAMFDDVMSRLVVAIDSSAREEFGDLIARHPNAPTRTSRILALDDEIKVARPFLSHSIKLDDATLIESAKTKSQDHLLAISQRDSIAEAVTDVIVERGNKKVVVNVAGNPGARFSEFGCSTLATRSYDDAELALRVWLRPDIPRQHLLSLFAKASDEVVKQLEAADRQKVQLYRYMVAQAKHQLQTKIRERSSDYVAARSYVEFLYQSGELSAKTLLTFAQKGQFDEATIALAFMCDLPIGHVERAVIHNQADHLLVLARAMGFSWETTSAILSMRKPTGYTAGRDIESYRASFLKLQPKTAISAMQFYRLRARAETQLEVNR